MSDSVFGNLVKTPVLPPLAWRSAGERIVNKALKYKRKVRRVLVETNRVGAAAPAVALPMDDADRAQGCGIINAERPPHTLAAAG